MTAEIKSVLLTVGRLPVALELARLFQENGWRVLVAEPLGWHVARLSNQVSRCFKVPSPVHDRHGWESRLLEIIDQESISLVIPVSEETLFVAGLKSRLGTKALVLSMNHDVLLALHDKWSFTEKAMQLGLAVPETALCDDDRVPSLMLCGAVVRKPRFGCAGVGVSRHGQGSALEGEQQRDSHVVQRSVNGAACCSFAIAVGGQIQLSVVYRPQVEAGSVAVCFEAVRAPEEVTRVVQVFVADTDFTGMIAFDHLWSEVDGWQVIECNPRATSGLHLLPPDEIFAAFMKAMDHLSNRVAQHHPPIDKLDASDTGVDERGLLTSASSGERLLPEGPRAQEFWSHLAELQGRLFRGRFQSTHWKRLFVTRDICWSRHDLKPALLFVPVNIGLMIRAWRAGAAIPQIVMQDIGWQPASVEPLRIHGLEQTVELPKSEDRAT